MGKDSSKQDAVAGALVASLARGERVDLPALVVVAHPDDETLFLSAVLDRLTQFRLVHVFDGPASPDEEGVALAALRRGELAAALAASGCRPAGCDSLGFPDRADVLPPDAAVAARIAPLLAHTRLVISHAVEGGHPAHDCVARAVRLARRERPDIVHLEFAAYGPGPGLKPLPGARRIPLDADRLAAKRRALAAFGSQRDLLRRFPVGLEWLRVADQD